MLDGRIDTQGTVKDLREQGLLEGIEHDTAINAQLAAAEAMISEEGMDLNMSKVAADDDMAPTKKPRKLVKDEHRETGGVKWSIYKNYLEASYAIFLRYRSHLLLNFELFQFVLDLGLPCLPGGGYSNPGCLGEALDQGEDERSAFRHHGCNFFFHTDMGRSL